MIAAMESRGDIRSWGRAVVSALVAVVLLGVVFAVVPDRLTKFIEYRSSAIVRDVVVTVWFGAAIVASVWTLVRLQRRGTI